MQDSNSQTADTPDAADATDPPKEAQSKESATNTPDQNRDAGQNSASAISSAWENGKTALQQELDPHIFSAYIEPLSIGKFDNDTKELQVKAPSKLVCNHVDRNFKDRISTVMSNHLDSVGLQVKISVSTGIVKQQFETKSSSSPYVVVKKVRSASNKPLKDSNRTSINSKYTFSNFVVGNSNQFCHAAANQVAEEPGFSYNPLFIYGGVGLGKTHLLHAIGNAVLERKPDTKVLYISSETFTNDLIQALRFGKMDAFKNHFRSIELLLIDDIQFMCGKERTQEEFFHTFNALYSARHQIVLTSDKIPQEIPGIEERLQTRFSWGLTADLQAPDFETRAAILNRKANLESFNLPQDVAQYIAENVSSNVRELEGALTRLHAFSSLQNIPISLALAESALKPILKPKTVNITVDEIKKVVGEHFGVKVSEMVSKRRTKNLSFPRHIAMYLCRKHTTCSYPEIGGHFGGRDHSSVIHAANVVSTKLKSNPEVQQHIEEIEAVLLN